jgi:hypothetical protein
MCLPVGNKIIQVRRKSWFGNKETVAVRVAAAVNKK